MKTNKYGTPKQRITNVVIALVIILIVSLLNGASYKPLMYKIFNDYEEVCATYQMNVTVKCNQESIGINDLFTRCNYENIYTPTDKCIEYELRRKVDIEPFIYSFEWCEVYPDSEDCELNSTKRGSKS